MTYDVKADWKVIDPADLAPEAATLYHAYKSSYSAMKAARDAFEASVATSADLPPHLRLAFGYNFGKLSLAVIPNDKPARKAHTPTGNLSSWLAAQRATGSRC